MLTLKHQFLGLVLTMLVSAAMLTTSIDLYGSPRDEGTSLQSADLPMPAIADIKEHTVFVVTSQGPVRSFTVEDGSTQCSSVRIEVPEGYRYGSAHITYPGEDYTSIGRHPGYTDRTDTYYISKVFWETSFTNTTIAANSDLLLFLELVRIETPPTKSKADSSGGCSMATYRRGSPILGLSSRVAGAYALSKLLRDKQTA